MQAATVTLLVSSINTALPPVLSFLYESNAIGVAVLIVALKTSLSFISSGENCFDKLFTSSLYSISLTMLLTTLLLACKRYLLPGINGFVSIQHIITSKS